MVYGWIFESFICERIYYLDSKFSYENCIINYNTLLYEDLDYHTNIL